MKIAAFRSVGGPRLGVVDEDGLWALPSEVDVMGLLAQAPEQREVVAAAARRSEEPHSLEALELLVPLQPTNIRDFVTFEAHVEGMSMHNGRDGEINPAWYEAPFFYFSNTNAVVPTGADVPVPPGCHDLDFELEVAAVLGRGGRDLSPDEAGSCIAAFTIFNDWSARDVGTREMRLGLGLSKAKDSASTVGPWLVTVDELEPYRKLDRYDLRLVASINGEPLGEDTLANMAWSFEAMVAYASRGANVAPGDLIVSGTCRNGCLAEQWGRRGRQEPPPLEPGDVVTLEVEGIGSVTNRVVEGAPAQDIPPARRGLNVDGPRKPVQAGS